MEIVDTDTSLYIPPKPPESNPPLEFVDPGDLYEAIVSFNQNIPEELKSSHEKALTELKNLVENPKLHPLIRIYYDALKSSDFHEINNFLSTIQGSEAIGEVARENYITQADDLLLGIAQISRGEASNILTFGYNLSYKTLEDIQVVLEEMTADINSIKELARGMSAATVGSDVYSEVLLKLDKYMFEGRSFRLNEANWDDAVIFQGENDPKIIENTERIGRVALSISEGSKRLLDKIALANKGDSETDNIFFAMKEIPKTVIIHATSKDFFSSHRGYHYALQNLLVDWYRLTPNQRPMVIMFTDGFEPQLYIKHSYQGFLFCSDKNELNNVMRMTNTLVENLQQELYGPETLVAGQKEAYNNSDLREWENKTADTYQSLRHIFEVITERKLLAEFSKLKYLDMSFKPLEIKKLMSFQDKSEYRQFFEILKQWRKFRNYTNSSEPPSFYELLEIANKSQAMNAWDYEIKTCLDIGTGEGRISGMLARLGINVMGLDISTEQLNKLKQRIIEEGEGLRGERSHPGLSYGALLKLKAEGLLPEEIVEDDEVIKHKLQTVEGSFFDLQYYLNQNLINWDSERPGVDKYAFFGASPYDEYAFSDERDMFADVGFDMALLNWHTFCEIGTPENQKMVLEQILNVLDRGGSLILEIPDKKIEPYASALRRYHLEHPDEPYGTIRDKKPADFHGLPGEDLYPPRYFPDINELILLLKSVGYEVSMNNVQTYLVQEDSGDGSNKMTLKEHFIVARKSSN